METKMDWLYMVRPRRRDWRWERSRRNLAKTNHCRMAIHLSIIKNDDMGGWWHTIETRTVSIQIIYVQMVLGFLFWFFDRRPAAAHYTLWRYWIENGMENVNNAHARTKLVFQKNDDDYEWLCFRRPKKRFGRFFNGCSTARSLRMYFLHLSVHFSSFFT